ncbi:MAG TPA: tetratricopeptide repeat protein [Vicinamibacterales bacterium]|nr:tetratricopeptide repeat protein [Vicinamibacterales bacterium]
MTRAAIAAALVLLNLFVYLQVRHHPFINFDDPQYVAENRQVTRGLTADGIRWAFTTPHAGNWHPLTWISHMIDVELFGLDAGSHHLVNLAFHVLNTLLLFAVLVRMTAATWASGFVAAMFAVHPTHVESVAWIAERKDVLSGLFWMLTLWAYARYAASPSSGRYLLVAAALAAGLMAKPMLVTLPFVLLLLDVWPLGRFTAAGARRVVLEKLPLVALAIASSVVTFVVQREAGAVKGIDALSVPRRAAAAVLGYVEYVGKTVWPSDLALLYPHPREVSPIAVVVVALLLAGITFAVVRAWRSRPYLAVGWFWFLGTLVPVIGLVQVGSQRIADRYTYLPSIGLFILVAWGGAELARRRLLPRAVVATAALLAVTVNAVVAERQTGRWASSIGLWQHTLAVTTDNARAHNHLGHALAAAGRRDEAIRQYEAALRMHPDYPEALNNLGAALAQRGDEERAIVAFRRALQLVPHLPHARSNLGLALARTGRPAEALEHFTVVVTRDPDNAEGRRHRGALLATLGRWDEAIAEYRAALRLEPADPLTHNALGAALGAAGREDDALRHYAEAVRLDPRFWEARGNLARSLIRSGRGEEGARELYDLSAALAAEGRFAEAADHLEALLTYDPGHQEGRRLLVDLAARARRR